MNPFKSYYRWAVRRLEWRYRLERKVMHKMFHPFTKSVKKLAAPPQRSRNDGPQIDIIIWYRPLKGLHISTRSISHWCVQVGNDYYELYKGSGHIKLELHSQNPFGKSEKKQISKTTYTQLSAEEVKDHAQKLFDQEFNEYSLGMEDCQQFCLRLLENICSNEKDIKDIRTDIYDKSAGFKMAASSNVQY